MHPPLISFATHGRNDGFMGDFLWRLSTCVNQIARNFETLGHLDDIEILIGDWGSERTPLREALTLEPAARRVTRFCTVPPAVAKRLNRDGDYGYSPAANIPIRRARGEFIFSMDSDAYMPLQTADLLWRVAKGENLAGIDLDRSFFWASRQHIPYPVIEQSPTIEQLDAFIAERPEELFFTTKCNLEEFRGGAVAIFGKRQHFHAIRGYNEALVHWGWHDVDIHYRMAMTFKPYDLWDVGGLMYHMEHYPQRGGAVAGGRKMTEQVFPTEQIVNSPDWGAIKELVEVTPAIESAAARPRNIVISGTNFWNPGDDFVRDGVIAVLRKLFPDTPLNFLFYNFNADFFPQSKFNGIANYISQGDLEKYRDSVDAVVIAGLSAGDEIKDLYDWVIANGLEDRVYLIGAGYENEYVAKYIQQEPEATIFRNARVVIGRTEKTPKFMQAAGIPYVHLNCPAMLSVPDVKMVPTGKKIERIAFSIQLPHGEGIPNHTCAAAQYKLAVAALRELSSRYQVEVIAHHKTEYFHFLNLFKDERIPVIFSSFYQDLHQIYPRYDLVITTRLHASLFANGHGIPGIIINDTDRHTHTLQGFPHSVWVNSREAFQLEFARMQRADLAAIALEAREFKSTLMRRYVETLAGPFGSNTQMPVVSNANTETLPVHFFTIVVNGRPFIEHHIREFARLPFRWHWHIVEGVADLKHDTAWSLKTGGQIPAAEHRNGLSTDGTTEYLDRMARENSGRVSIHRKPGAFWDGKLEMVNRPLENISEQCLLWQVDADELWTAEQITKARAMFLAQPEKTAARYRCHYFVGKNLVVTSRDTYSDRADEWLRTWRFQPGDHWISHEPPVLTRGAAGKEQDVALNAFTKDETEAQGLVFHHYAYAIEPQIRFKESYYGYKNAVAQWQQLQCAQNFPVALSHYFAWVDDAATVDTIQSQSIRSLAPAHWFTGAFAPSSIRKQFNPVLLLRQIEYGKGVHGQEGSMRWLANSSEIRLPAQLLQRSVNLTFTLAAGDLWCYGKRPFQAIVKLDGKPLRHLLFNRDGHKFDLTVRLEPSSAARLLTIESTDSFIPAQIDRNSRDQRRLAVKLSDLAVAEIAETRKAVPEPELVAG